MSTLCFTSEHEWLRLEASGELTGHDSLAAIKAIAAKNELFRNHIGQGYFPCQTGVGAL
ncbi:hypothetical protein HK44_007265 [Pseudomonas fluorescens HK44]|uniref:Uncharacterized protein n=1 Tax=Pseudomonas fluorescens HK44 TaxID=1042209 RepID=A0A010ST19_PSEFL|nr:hypothetical protein [Pseudomonas fluorescens]EXF94118.1 hypothetical protein HK44_007265 [Pseudomonas fluorescens HK44]